jgi:hypothetical protein
MTGRPARPWRGHHPRIRQKPSKTRDVSERNEIFGERGFRFFRETGGAELLPRKPDVGTGDSGLQALRCALTLRAQRQY